MRLLGVYCVFVRLSAAGVWLWCFGARNARHPRARRRVRVGLFHPRSTILDGETAWAWTEHLPGSAGSADGLGLCVSQWGGEAHGERAGIAIVYSSLASLLHLLLSCVAHWTRDGGAHATRAFANGMRAVCRLACSCDPSPARGRDRFPGYRLL